MSWGYNDSTVRRPDRVGATFQTVAKAFDGLERSEARRVLRAVWIALGLDEIDPVRSPHAVRDDEDPGACADCGAPHELVRPGKTQPTCECGTSQPEGQDT